MLIMIDATVTMGFCLPHLWSGGQAGKKADELFLSSAVWHGTVEANAGRRVSRHLWSVIHVAQDFALFEARASVQVRRCILVPWLLPST